MSSHIPEEELFAYLDGDPPPGGHLGLEEHLRDCDTCKDRLCRVVRVHAALVAAPLTADVKPDVWAAVEAELDETTRPKPPRSLAQGLGIAAAASMLLIAGFVAGRAVGPSASTFEHAGVDPGSRSDVEEVVLEIQRAGSEYAAALVALGEVEASAGELRRGVEVASAAAVATSIELTALTAESRSIGISPRHSEQSPSTPF